MATREITVKLSHRHYLDRWLGLYEYDEYKKWLFSGIIRILRKYVKSGRILEIGCAKGYLTYILNKMGYEAIGVDISLTALKQGLRIDSVMLDAEQLSFRNNCFNAVVSVHTLEHLPRPERSIAEIFRVLNKNGLFLAVTPDKDSVLAKLGYRLVEYTALKNPYHVGLMNRKELRAILKKSGFKAIVILPFHNGFFGFPIIHKLTKRYFIPLPISTRFFIPFSHHQLVVALK